jgi:hypothetical protein
VELVALALAALIAAWVWLAGKQGTGTSPSAPGDHLSETVVALRRLWWQPVEEPVPRTRGAFPLP